MMSEVCVHQMYAHPNVRTSDVRTPQGFSVLHHICSTIFPLILGVKVLHIRLYLHNTAGNHNYELQLHCTSVAVDQVANALKAL